MVDNSIIKTDYLPAASDVSSGVLTEEKAAINP
jgi:hypothetical protein